MATPLSKPPRPDLASSSLPHAPASQSGSLDDAAVLAALQVDVERARAEYALRSYEPVSEILAHIISTVRRALDTETLVAQTRAEFELLLGASLCLRGRLLRNSGREKEAAQAFLESADLFRQHTGELLTHRSASRLNCDYGIALFRAGKETEAIEALLRSSESGAAPQETFGYLGLAYKNRGEFDKAEEALRKGLQLAPRDPVLWSAFAEALELREAPQAQTLEAYREAVRAAKATDNVSSAARLLDRALRLAPADPATVRLAVDVYMQQGHRDLEKALAITDNALALQPDQPLFLGLKGKVLRALGSNEEAIAMLRRVEVGNREFAWISVELAEALCELGRNEEALPELDRAIGLRPHDGRALVLKGAILIDLGKPQEAMQPLELAIEAEPQSALARYETGRALYFCNELQKALQAFDEALSYNPEWGLALAAKAILLLELKEPDQAIALMRRVLRIEPDNALVFERMIEALSERGRNEEALQELDREISRNPESATAHWLKGKILLAEGEYQPAADALQFAADRQPERTEVQLALASVRRSLGEYDKAGERFRTALELEPASPLTMGWYGIYLGEIGDLAEGAKILEEATRAAPDQGWLFRALGWAFQYRDRFSAEPARQAYEKSISLNPENPWNRKGLADALFLAGKGEAAGEAFEDLIREMTFSSAQEDASALYLLGWCQYRQARYDEAMRLFQAALNLNPELVFAYFDLALVTLCSGRVELATAKYERSLESCSRIHVLRQRGLLYVALFDLVEAMESGRIKSGFDRTSSSLRERSAAVGLDLASQSWLGKTASAPIS